MSVLMSAGVPSKPMEIRALVLAETEEPLQLDDASCDCGLAALQTSRVLASTQAGPSQSLIMRLRHSIYQTLPVPTFTGRYSYIK